MTRFGIRLLDDLGRPAELVRLAALADHYGLDSVWYPHDTLRPHSWALATATAAATDRIQIGCVGTNPWSTHPAEVVTFLTTLDELSGGRALLGLGLHTTEHLAWVGVDVGDYLLGTREAYEIITKLLAGGEPAYDGEVFRIGEHGHLRYTPARRNIPIYICPFGEEYLELSGEIGAGSLPMITPPESAALMVEPILRGARRAGRAPAELDIAGLAWISVSDDGAAARDRLSDIVAYFGTYLEAPALATVGVAPEDYLPARERIMQGDRAGARALISEQMLQLGIVGTPSECREQIQQVIEAGITHVLLGGPLGPDPAEAIRLIGEEIVPYFR